MFQSQANGADMGTIPPPDYKPEGEEEESYDSEEEYSEESGDGEESESESGSESESAVSEPRQVRSRLNRPTGTAHFGDEDFEVEDDYGDASWGEVFETCCIHSSEEWAWIAAGILGVAFFLYFFLVGLELLSDGAKVMCGCKAGELFGDDTNPIAGLMVGILSTVLLQSSSTTTSVIVSLVGSAISVSQGIYMIMGANIGTSVTNTLVAIGQMSDGDQLERAFAGATVHDMFNFMSVAILLPVEVVTGYLMGLTNAMVKHAENKSGGHWEGPVKKLVSPLGVRIIKPNKDLVKGIASGNGSCSEDDGYYPMHCAQGKETYDACYNETLPGKGFGLIACDEDLGCPAFFQSDSDAQDDKVSGGVVFFIALCILFTCLIALITVLQKLLLGMSTRIVYKATDVNGYVALAIGAGITMVVQSSSITTSTLTPLVGMGVLRLEQMYPLTLGANIGTTFTAFLAALVAEEIEPLQVALAHLFFNISGILIFYPIPFMRRIPMSAARRLGKVTRIWRGFPILYIAVMFFLAPLLFLGLSSIFERHSKGFRVLGSFLTVVLAFALFGTAYWCRYMRGRETCALCMSEREKKRLFLRDLPGEVEYLRSTVALLVEHTGLPPPESYPVDKEPAL